MTTPEGRATTPEHKRRIIECLYSAWLAAPEHRLGQLIFNAQIAAAFASSSSDVFYTEDDDLAELLVNYVRQLNELNEAK